MSALLQMGEEGCEVNSFEPVSLCMTVTTKHAHPHPTDKELSNRYLILYAVIRHKYPNLTSFSCTKWD